MEVDAERMVAGGDALAHAGDGRVVLVAGALPGERVRTEIFAERRDLLRARVVDILDPSPHRVDPPCPHRAAGCGGCTWQHIDAVAQRDFRRDIIVDALHRIAKLDDVPLQPTVELPDAGYRTTVRALVVDGRAAFRREATHDAVEVDHCLVAHPLVDDVLHHGRFPGAREIVVRAGARTGERAVLADPSSLAVSVASDVRTGRDPAVHEVIEGTRLRISTRSFFQTRPDGADALVRLVRDAAGRGQVVADLYAGVGLFAATLDTPRQVVAVERARSAVADARRNLRDHPAEVVRADVDRWSGAPVDVVIADPSRTGLGRGGARTVMRCDASRVVLVSCDAAALARDVALLRDGGFHPVAITPVDLFPHTPHIEAVTVFDR